MENDSDAKIVFLVGIVNIFYQSYLKTRNIVFTHLHESYIKHTFKNDIALFLMDTAVDTSVYIPVCMPSSKDDHVGQTGKAF